MLIGLVDIDGHAKKKKWGATVYPNLALAKIARYHRQQGDTVEWVNKHQIFQITDFADFEPRKGFKCKKYFELFEL
jgi:hypothetical protein